MISAIEFFKNLPRKKCSKCGNEMDEKADCYHNICDECDHPAR
ncbi:protein YhfH [Bacillaceae bacterium S4-13-58]